MALRPNLVRRQVLRRGPGQVRQVVVGDGDALGPAGRARGVDEVGDIFWGSRPGQVRGFGVGLVRDSRITHIDHR